MLVKFLFLQQKKFSNKVVLTYVLREIVVEVRLPVELLIRIGISYSIKNWYFIPRMKANQLLGKPQNQRAMTRQRHPEETGSQAGPRTSTVVTGGLGFYFPVSVHIRWPCREG